MAEHVTSMQAWISSVSEGFQAAYAVCTAHVALDHVTLLMLLSCAAASVIFMLLVRAVVGGNATHRNSNRSMAC